MTAYKWQIFIELWEIFLKKKGGMETVFFNGKMWFSSYFFAIFAKTMS
jgi:hypothetical protein